VRLQPQVCNWAVEPSVEGEGSQTPYPAFGYLQQGEHCDTCQSLGGLGVSVLTAPQGSAAAVATLDQEALRSQCRVGKATLRDQCPSNGSPAFPPQAYRQTSTLWHYPPGLTAQTDDSDQNRSLGCDFARLFRNRFASRRCYTLLARTIIPHRYQRMWVCYCRFPPSMNLNTVITNGFPLILRSVLSIPT